MKKDAVFDREIVRLSGLKVKAKSFALPAVEPGVIVEYRWIEQRPFASYYTRLQLQREFPIQAVKYYIKPMSEMQTALGMGMRSISFHCPNVPFVKERDGYHSVSFNNVSAFTEEPHMPPEDQVRPWMLLYYSNKDKIVPEKFWKDHGKAVYEESKGAMKVNDDVRRAATEAIGDASAPEQKLERLVAFCRTKIKNIHDDTTVMSEQERKKLKENRSPADTLKRGYGDAQNIKQIEHWVTQTAPSASVLKSEPKDDSREGKFALDVEFKSPNYAQLMRGRLMVFKPAIVSRRSSVFLTETKRKHPVVLDSEAYNETVRIKLPEGFDVDEMPDAVELNQPFGNYAAKCEVKDGHLIFRRSMALKAGIIPVEEYASVRGFFDRMRAVEQTPVVLVKK